MKNFFYNEDKSAIGVLISTGWGGWPFGQAQIAWDKEVIKTFIENKNNFRVKIQEFGYDDSWFEWGDINDLLLIWVPVGIYWRIIERNGYEFIDFFYPEDWEMA